MWIMVKSYPLLPVVCCVLLFILLFVFRLFCVLKKERAQASFVNNKPNRLLPLSSLSKTANAHAPFGVSKLPSSLEDFIFSVAIVGEIRKASGLFYYQ